MDRTILPPSTVPPNLEAQRTLMSGPDQASFEICYLGSWRCLVEDLGELEAKHVYRFLDLLEADGRCMAGQGAAQLMRDRPDLHASICKELDNVLHPDKWTRDEEALEEFMEGL